MKKKLAAVIAVFSLVTAGIPGLAEDTIENIEMDALEAAAKADETLPARSAILMEQDTGRVLFEKNPDEPMPPASITKVMTLLLTMEAIESGQIRLTDMAACSEYAASMGGSQIWLEPGEEMSVDDLLKATAIASANDAAVDLAELVAGSEEAFVDRMNARAEELGMENTHFMNATGLDEEGHVSTARDIALMSRALLQYPLISEYSKIWMSSLRSGETQLVNTNKLIRFYNGCTGLKTGTTDGAGSCLSASATRKGLSLIAVTLGSPTSAERFSAARGLLDYGFANYIKAPIPPLEGIGPVHVTRGVEDQVQVQANQPDSVIIRSGQQVKITQEPELAEEVEAPVEAGQRLGKVAVKMDGELLLEYDLVAATPIERMTFLTALKFLLNELVAIG